ncbi:hypothetical protein [Gracilibacillus sp. JCM 18860]|uniref:hypothetical protein n=1 Tax=Gracilibacillus sp. JCM 18860 TaxID=1306159 RepID=UPI0006D1B396
MKKFIFIITLLLTFSLILDGVSVQAISTSENPENVLAFPGAEGGEGSTHQVVEVRMYMKLQQ